MPSYQNLALSAWPEDQRPIHIAMSGLRKPIATDNHIERLNGTLRERVKVQRGWKPYKTPLAEGMRVHYNFVRPHMVLDGQTPAEAAGIDLNLEGNRWMQLIKRHRSVLGSSIIYRPDKVNA